MRGALRSDRRIKKECQNQHGVSPGAGMGGGQPFTVRHQSFDVAEGMGIRKSASSPSQLRRSGKMRGRGRRGAGKASVAAY